MWNGLKTTNDESYASAIVFYIAISFSQVHRDEGLSGIQIKLRKFNRSKYLLQLLYKKSRRKCFFCSFPDPCCVAGINNRFIYCILQKIHDKVISKIDIHENWIWNPITDCMYIETTDLLIKLKSTPSISRTLQLKRSISSSSTISTSSWRSWTTSKSQKLHV